MKRIYLIRALAITSIMALSAGQAIAEEIRVAVASNFADAIKTITQQFEANTGHKITLSFGSTGKHYAQIKNGAPFHVFFAADTKRPKLLDKEGLIIPGSRFTYAVGKIVLWSPQVGMVDEEADALKQGKFNHLAIANPKLAPYGKAAQEVLKTKGLWNELRGKMVRGENIGHTFQFVKSGNAELGFVAYSQVKRPGQTITGSIWEVPQNLYSPIAQQAVILKDTEGTQKFMQFIRSKQALDIIEGYGYGIP